VQRGQWLIVRLVHVGAILGKRWCRYSSKSKYFLALASFSLASFRNLYRYFESIKVMQRLKNILFLIYWLNLCSYLHTI
jgi:hypothetical protein